MIGALNVGEDQAVEAIARLQADAKRLAKEVQELKVKAALSGGSAHGGHAGGAGDKTFDVGGVPFVVRRVDNLDRDALRQLSDQVKDRLKSGGVVLISVSADQRVAMVSSVTADLTGRFHAGNIMKALAPIVGGKGGGRPDFAEAGGADASKIDELLSQAPSVIGSMDTQKP